MPNKRQSAIDILLIGVLAAVIYFPFLGDCALFDWDEVNFAECAREMIVSGNYSQVQLNYQVFWEKPPLFIWLQVLSMKLFGINEFAARFPNAVCSIVTLCSLYIIGKRHYSRRFALLWVVLYLGSLLPHFYFKTGIIDPWFNLFIFLALYHLFVVIQQPQLLRALLSGLFLGAAVLTKGPAALVIAALTIVSYLLVSNNWRFLTSKPFWLFFVATLFFSTLWFIVEWLKGNGHIISAFINYQIRLFQTKDAGHGGPFFYHFIVLLLGCFPSSILFVLFYRNKQQLNEPQIQFRKMMVALFWTVLLLFSLVETKIVHYSSLAYFPLTYVAALALINIRQIHFVRSIKIVYWFVTVSLGLAALLMGTLKWTIPYLLNNKLITDRFTAGNLSANVQWSAVDSLLPLVFAGAAIVLYVALNKQQLKLFLAGLCLNTVFIVWVILRIIPGIELYVQAAPIAFYKACAGTSCNIETHAFKSYAYLFYSQRQPQDYHNPHQQEFIQAQLNTMESEGHSRLSSYSTANQLWMEHGQVNRPTYIVIKADKADFMKKFKYFSELYTLNGYSFFVRLPDKPVK